MTNLQLFTAYQGKQIAHANATEEGQKDVDEFMNLSVNDTINFLAAIVAAVFEIPEGDRDMLEKKMDDVTMKQLYEYYFDKVG